MSKKNLPEQDIYNNFNVQRQLRPIRLAYVVLPEDLKTLRTVLESNTCLWGGVQNPIIPLHGRRPKHWENRWEWPGGVEYAKGLLNGFEPDFVVETKKGLAAKLDLPERRVIALVDVLDKNRDPHVGYGVSAVDVLRHAYDKELKFVRRQKLKAVWSDVARPTLFEAAALGVYPEDESLQYFKRAFTDAFEPESVAGNHAAIFDALVSQSVTPLRAHQYGLEAKPGMGWRSYDPVLFLLDPECTSDVIDFWNLRAWGVRCFPVPTDSVKETAAVGADLITRANVRLRGNPDPNMRHQTTLLKARSVSRQAFEQAAELLQPRPQHSLVLQKWMPRYWHDSARRYDVNEHGELVGASDDMDVIVEDRNIRFDLLKPGFGFQLGWAGLPRWANTVSLRDFSSTETGLVFPRDGEELRFLLRASDHGGLQALRNGIAVVSTGANVTQHWVVPDGQAVVREWFKVQKLPFKPSAAGKTAVEVARALGGLHGLRILDSVEVLKMLEGASEGGAILHHELLGLLKKVEEHPEAPGNVLRSLVQRNVLRIGLHLDCPSCETEGWFALEELATPLRCGRCLRTFAFPGDRPPYKKWAYRTQGPFALSGYAKGAYATLFALRCLGPTHDAEMTWFPGCEIGPEGSKYELDFVAFWRKRWARSGPVRVLIGECKTFDKFTQKEVSRFRDVARHFPETIRVFATLRQELEDHERAAIASLAREGRRLGGSRSPVLVLTAMELLSTSQPPYCYEDAGPRFEKFKNFNVAPMAGDDGLLGLCDLTQQVHLGMEPMWESVDRELARRQARKHIAGR
jgi:hypothetical protein